MPSDPQFESQADARVSKLVFSAIKSLKKTRGSSSEAILQQIRSRNSCNIDATDVERCLKIAHAKKIIISRTNKKTGIKFYRAKTVKNVEKETEDEKNLKSGKKSRKWQKSKTKKDTVSTKKSEAKAKDSRGAGNKEPATQKIKMMCDICKVLITSKKNLKDHELGKKHLNNLKKIKEKEQRKGKNSSNSSHTLTDKMDANDNNSSNTACDTQCTDPSETNRDDSNRKKSYSSDYRHSLSPPGDFQSPNSAEKNRDFSNKKKSYSHDYRNNYSKSKLPSNNRDSYHRDNPNYRDSYHNNRKYDNRNYHWNRWPPNPPFRNDLDQRFQPFNDYNRYDQNYHFNQSPWMENGPPPMFNNWTGMPNTENNNYFSENIQSENIQPDEGITNFETHSNNTNSDEIINTSVDEQKTPSRRSIKVSDKKAKRSPVISLKDITKTASTVEDVQSQSGSEKQQEKGIVLSENMTGKRLAHWINPSNQKDQAEIRRLVNQFSKSKKMENLLKLKLHTDKVAVNSDGNLDAIEETNNVSSLPMPSEALESENSAEVSPEATTNISSCSLEANSTDVNKRRRSSSFTDVALNASSPIRLPPTRSRSDSLNIDENAKKPQKNRTRRTASNSSESPSSRKRKESVELGNNSKKHKCSSAECLEKCIESAIENEGALHLPERTESNETASLTINTASKDFSLPKEGVYIKKEIENEMVTDTTPMASLSLNELIQKQTDAIAGCQDDATMTPVESLINLFATGNITIKKEFDDPLIDAIRSIDPVLLNKVCEDQPVQNVASQDTVEKPIEPVTAPLPAIPDSSLASSSTAPSLTLSLKNILNELQIISEEEEKVKDNLLKADQQIQYYQSLLDGWKTKKIKFQSEEEILRNKRNTLVRTMNDLVVQQSSDSKSTVDSPVLEEKPLSSTLQSTDEINNTTDAANNEPNSIESNQTNNDSSTSPQQDITPEKPEKTDSEDDIVLVENDEIVILPVPESRIPVIDLDHIGSPDKRNDTDIFSKKNSNTDNISANCHKIRDLVAHNAVVNTIQIFDDYIYTCANDKMAKRFSLKDPTQIITYTHAEKNILHLCVEKMRGKTYVFTSAFNSNLITVFDAQTALKVQVYQFRPTIASMCKSRCKIYVGLRNGSIVTCDWKETKELVNIEEPIRSIALTNQGGINVLVTLSTKGHVSIRDADRSGLLIKYVKALAHVPLCMSIYNDWVYLSSAGYLSVLDLSSGTFVKKYELPAAYTSLTVYKSHIFTTSFSGFVRCYSKFDIQDMRAYYGAGKMALTCIHVHDGWVFTGNKTGEISVFKFDPDTSLPCQFGKCQMVFARLDDLMYHVLQGKDHNLISMKTCQWRKCNTTIKKSWDQETIQNHIRAHITASFPYLHEPMYNLIV